MKKKTNVCKNIYLSYRRLNPANVLTLGAVAFAVGVMIHYQIDGALGVIIGSLLFIITGFTLLQITVGEIK